MYAAVAWVALLLPPGCGGLAAAGWRPRFDALFVGDFDNVAQITGERARGVAARDRAGHEHVHCCLRPLRAAHGLALAGAADATLAVYYLDGDPARVFRARVYAVDTRGVMALHRPPAALADHAAAACATVGADGADRVAAALASRGARWEPLPNGCSVRWAPDGAGFAGRTPPGGCLIQSQEPGRGAIRVEDALALDDRGLRVDDRGYAPDGTLLYGSPDGGPYDLVRVDPEGDPRRTL